MKQVYTTQHITNSRQSGFAALEAIVTLAVLVALLVGGLATGYAVFARIWLERSAYEASICLASSSRESDCEQTLKKSIQSALPIGEIVNISLRRTPTSVTVKIDWRIGQQKAGAFKVNDSRSLPLIKRRWRWRSS